MRIPTLLGIAALATFAASAHAEDLPAPPVPTPATPSSPTSISPAPASASASASDDSIRARVAAQGAAIAALTGELDQERQARLHPWIRVSGFLQVDWVIHNQESQNQLNESTGVPLNQDRFTLRRGHVRVDAEKGPVFGVLEIDANTVNGPQVRPIEASVAWRWPERPDPRVPAFEVKMGLQRIPFGYEVQEFDFVRPFLERANVMQALFPGEYDLGLKFRMNYRFLDMGLAVMNGNPIGAKEFPDLDPVAAKELVGRIGVHFEIAPGVRFEAGASGDAGTGFHPGTPATAPQLVWQDQNGDGLVEPNEITAVGGEPATPSQLFHRFAVGGDARIMVRVAPFGDLTFRGEAVNAMNLDRNYEVADPIGAGHDLREQGWSGGVTQELTRWGMIGARYDVYNPDADATQQRTFALVPINRTYSTLALMGMLRYEGARLLLEYDINRNALGVAANGTPTNLAANALTLRGQMVF